MTKSVTAAPPLTLDIDVNDDDAVVLAAMALDTTPEVVRAVLTFAQSVMTQAAEHEMTRAQLITALLSVLTVMVEAYDEPLEQGQLCFRLFEGLWASCDLPRDIAFMQEAKATASYELLPRSTESEQIH